MYARHSLYNECEAQSRNGGLVHLTVASVYLELGGFRRCLEVRNEHKWVMMVQLCDKKKNHLSHLDDVEDHQKKRKIEKEIKKVFLSSPEVCKRMKFQDNLSGS